MKRYETVVDGSKFYINVEETQDTMYVSWTTSLKESAIHAHVSFPYVFMGGGGAVYELRPGHAAASKDAEVWIHPGARSFRVTTRGVVDFSNNSKRELVNVG